jgi:hypothetical protein
LMGERRSLAVALSPKIVGAAFAVQAAFAVKADYTTQRDSSRWKKCPERELNPHGLATGRF